MLTLDSHRTCNWNRLKLMSSVALLALMLAADVRVLVFVRTDCPITNRYAPELQRIAKEFQDRPVEFAFVYPDPSETEQGMKEHMKTYGLPGTWTRDPGHELERKAHATVAPEAAVFDRSGHLKYHGRIDDRYVSPGVARPTAKVHDLEDAITAVVAGKAVARPETKAVGCSLADFNHDVAPIVFQHCSPCHRPGEAGPFSLLSYDDVRKHASQIADVTRRRYMPPWLLEHGYGNFSDEQRLTADQIATISDWAEHGAPEGRGEITPPEVHRGMAVRASRFSSRSAEFVYTSPPLVPTFTGISYSLRM